MADQDTHVEVRMKVVSGKGEDSQWFDYRPGFFHDIVRVEWDLGTMDAALQTDAAEYLIRHGYAERLSPEQEPAPIVQEQEPLVVETIDPPPAEQTPPSSDPPPTEGSQSGGKQKKKEKSK